MPYRFGVEQRAKLYGKASPTPHVLTMTATPIPRTLALVAHGDMALSALNELPPGRIPTTTHILKDGKMNRQKVWPCYRGNLTIPAMDEVMHHNVIHICTILLQVHAMREDSRLPV